MATTSNPKHGENITAEDLPTRQFRRYLDEIETSISALDIALTALSTPNAVTADFTDETSTINTTFKFLPKFNTTLGKPYFPTGNSINDAWVDSDGLNPLTPV